MGNAEKDLGPVSARSRISSAQTPPNARATVLAFANLLSSDPGLNALGSREAVQSRAFLTKHRAVLLKSLLPHISACSRGGLVACLLDYPSGKSLNLYVDDTISTWHVVESGVEIPLEARRQIASGRHFMSLLFWLRPALARGEALSRCLALAATSVFEGRQQ